MRKEKHVPQTLAGQTGSTPAEPAAQGLLLSSFFQRGPSRLDICKATNHATSPISSPGRPRQPAAGGQRSYPDPSIHSHPVHLAPSDRLRQAAHQTCHLSLGWDLSLKGKDLSNIFLKRMSLANLKEGSEMSSWSSGFRWEEPFVLQKPLGFGHQGLKSPLLAWSVGTFHFPDSKGNKTQSSWGRGFAVVTPHHCCCTPTNERDIGSLGSVCAWMTPGQLRERIE